MAQLDINHSVWMTNIVKKYQALIEQEFGTLHFKNEPVLRCLNVSVEAPF